MDTAGPKPQEQMLESQLPLSSLEEAGLQSRNKAVLAFYKLILVLGVSDLKVDCSIHPLINKWTLRIDPLS